MPKFSTRGILAAFALFVALTFGVTMNSSVAHAQAVTPQTSSSSTGCTVGCPGTSSVAVMTVGQIGGSFMGTFGSFDIDGNAVEDDSLAGEVDGYKFGSVKARGAVTLTGPACGITCGQTNLNSSVEAQEEAGVSVMLHGTKAGRIYAGANSASVAAGGGIAVQFQSNPISTPATSTHTGN